MATEDRVFQLRTGVWCCLVNGRTFGTWSTKKFAEGGMRLAQEAEKKRNGQQQLLML